MEMSISQKALKNLDKVFSLKFDGKETVGEMINATLNCIEKGYIPGLIASLPRRPSDWARMITLEKDINHFAKEGDKESLMAVLDEYKDFFSKMAR